MSEKKPSPTQELDFVERRANVIADIEKKKSDAIDTRRALYFEKGTAAGALLGGSLMSYFGSGVAVYAGVGIASVGAYMLFPKVRPLIKGVIDRLPVLSKKEKDE